MWILKTNTYLSESIWLGNWCLLVFASVQEFMVFSLSLCWFRVQKKYRGNYFSIICLRALSSSFILSPLALKRSLCHVCCFYMAWAKNSSIFSGFGCHLHIDRSSITCRCYPLSQQTFTNDEWSSQWTWVNSTWIFASSFNKLPSINSYTSYSFFLCEGRAMSLMPSPKGQQARVRLKQSFMGSFRFIG